MSRTEVLHVLIRDGEFPALRNLTVYPGEMKEKAKLRHATKDYGMSAR